MTNESDMEWNGLAGFTRTNCRCCRTAFRQAENLFPLVLGQSSCPFLFSRIEVALDAFRGEKIN